METRNYSNEEGIYSLNKNGLNVIKNYLLKMFDFKFDLEELSSIYESLRIDICIILNETEFDNFSNLPDFLKSIINQHFVAYFCGNSNGNLMVLSNKIKEKQENGTLFERTYDVDAVFEYEKQKSENLRTDYFFFKIGDVCDFVEIKGSSYAVEKIMDYMIKEKVHNLISF